MATREEVRRTDDSKLGRAVLNSRSSVMRGLRAEETVAEVKPKKVEKKAKKTAKKD
tara:strand:- start:205 stop:372 length:168 start_codon:yes stop_codon:yes gene_type:complete